MFKNLFDSVLVFLLLLVGINHLTAQETFQCGVSSNLQPSDLGGTYSTVISTSENGTTASDTQFDLPIHLVILDDGDANISQILTQFNSSLIPTNEAFTDNYSFYLCSFEVVDVLPEEYDFIVSDENWEDLYNQGHSENAINIYIVGGIGDENGNGFGGVAKFPWSVFPNNALAMRAGQLWRDDLLVLVRI